MLEEECMKMFGTKSLNDEHDCNVVSMNSYIHDAYDMQRPKLGDAMFDENDMFENLFAQLMFVPSLGIPCLMNMIFLASQVLMSKFIMMTACLLFMMVILMKVGLEECQL
mgnify:CR=1 FL=1